MSKTLIEKITAEISSYYTTATQYRPDNNIAFRTKIRQTINSKLQPYVDKKLIASYTVVCDESNNVSRDIKQPLRLDVLLEVTKKSPRHIISFPLKQESQPQQKAGQKSNSLWNELNDISDGAVSLWDKLTGKKK
ncbi:MAG: hypothetical protein Q7U38_00490 [Methylobacter sp.]|nr:hypothetical protein [Methylobacter sp.]MDP2097749.1 hypothetical protein [Methylobacter sp.]MDP2430225.1 hypothetical protein [Methylobacter sp.]MDP3056160.1 hypothetical protein [Methylobacter sp.]MDP3364347.1 hypothetical protein [Methylobacter sp.]